jgi:hypothetical protein
VLRKGCRRVNIMQQNVYTCKQMQKWHLWNYSRNQGTEAWKRMLEESEFMHNIFDMLK